MGLRILRSSQRTLTATGELDPVGSVADPLHYWEPHPFQLSPAGSWHQFSLALSTVLFSLKSQTYSLFLISFPWLQLTTQFLCLPSQKTLHTTLAFSSPVVSEMHLTLSTPFYLLCYHQVQVNIISCPDNCSQLPCFCCCLPSVHFPQNSQTNVLKA